MNYDLFGFFNLGYEMRKKLCWLLTSNHKFEFLNNIV